MKFIHRKLGLLLLLPVFLLAHSDKKYEDISVIKKEKTVSVLANESNLTKAVIRSINTTYLKDIEPIFKAKCFDCHGSVESLPWYYNVPGIKQLMDYDMEESKEHLDMRKDFPFVSHETPLNDLKSLKEVVEEGEMPPIQYVLGHWDSRLTEDEKKKLYEWIDSSLEILGGIKGTVSTFKIP